MSVVNAVLIGVATLVGLFLLALAAALYFIARPQPPIAAPKDVFGFAALGDRAAQNPPAIRRYAARDGEQLAYRLYDSPTDRVLVFVHGSSYHGAGYHPLAAALSAAGAAKVVLPNLRGHYLSGRHRGDVEYIGQLEDDIADLIAAVRRSGLAGPLTLGGHSSGGGFVVRFAGGPHAGLASSFLVLAPAIPLGPAVRGGDGGGWASVHLRRIYGLTALNAIGIHGFDGLPVIDFNKPVQYWDGTETLTYSHRLNVSYHPRLRYQDDMRALGERALVAIGERDEAFDPQIMRAMFAADAPKARFEVLPGINHLGLITEPAAHAAIAAWLTSLPPAER
jgi:pimeloyl-ACP methyl ester carboxylesterase